jgi:hypothetical protein
LRICLFCDGFWKKNSLRICMFCNGFWKKKKKKKNSCLLREGDTKLHTSKNKSDCTLKVEGESSCWKNRRRVSSFVHLYSKWLGLSKWIWANGPLYYNLIVCDHFSFFSMTIDKYKISSFKFIKHKM